MSTSFPSPNPEQSSSHSPSSPSTTLMDLPSPPPVAEGESPSKPLLGKSTFVWTLSGLAFTTGLTIALIPALRRNRQRQQVRMTTTTTTNVMTGRDRRQPVQQLVGGKNTRVDEETERSLSGGKKGGGGGGGGVLDGLLGPSAGNKPISQANSFRNSILPGSSTSTRRGTTTTGRAGESLVSPLILSSLPALHAGGSSSIEANESRPIARDLDTVGSSTHSDALQHPVNDLPSSSSSSVISGSTTSNVVDPSMTDSPPEQQQPQPQIKYFSIHPSDPFSDEEDEFGFPRHDPGDPTHKPSGELDEGEHRGDHDDGSPFWALKAFSIATGLVLGSAAIGVGLIGWGFGVRNMEEFTAEMRRLTAKKLPLMSENIFKPLPEEMSDDDEQMSTALSRRIGFEPPPPRLPRRRTPEDVEEETVVSGWWREVVEGAEEERRARATRSEVVGEGGSGGGRGGGNHQV